jgi:hypothetical protein
VEEFCAHEPASLFGKPPRAIHLPVKEIPVQAYEWDSDLSHWVSPTEFGAIPEDNRDDTDAFQKAIDTPGKTTLYLPKTGFEQTFTINGTLRVRGDIRRVLACDILSIGGKGRIVVEDGSAPVVVLERLGTDWNAKVPFEHNTRRTVVFSTIVAPLVIGNGAGDCFLNDVCALLRFNNPRQHLWGRQLNPESAQESCIINNGATFWGLGAKIEYGATALETLNGGKSELFGLHYYDVHKIRPEQVMFVIENASATLVNIRETQFSGPENFKLAVRETRGGETRVLRNTECPVGGLNGFGLPLYIASPDNDSPK